jgi:hypothetical protein
MAAMHCSAVAPTPFVRLSPHGFVEEVILEIGTPALPR